MALTSLLPPIVPFPPLPVRENIPIELWTTCLETWQSILKLYLHQDADLFECYLAASPNIPVFLSDYLEQILSGQSDANLQHAQLLRADVFRLACRVLEVKSPPELLLHWPFLAHCFELFPKNARLSRISRDVWRKHEALSKSLKTYRENLSGVLDAGKVNSIDHRQLQHLIHLARGCPPAGKVLVTGTDFVDSVTSAYSKMSRNLQSSFATLLYFSLVSLLGDEEPNISLFVDQLYNLKELAKSEKATAGRGKSLLADLVSQTPLLAKAERHGVRTTSGRGRELLDALRTLQRSASPGSRPHRSKRRPRQQCTGENINGSMHVHRLSLITQIQDLFPHLTSAYITELLDEYSDDVEQVTAHLLDGSLPPQLQNPDAVEYDTLAPSIPNSTKPNLAPESTASPATLPARRNIHDNDAFDRLAIRPSQIHHGKRTSHPSHPPTQTDSKANKAAILSALAAFDADDDERDDTYDLADVGGTVDSSENRPGGVFEAEAKEMPAAPSTKQNVDRNDDVEQALYSAYKSAPQLFARDAATRRSQPRRALKESTHMTDEAIEGWAVMLQRDGDGAGSGRRLRALEDKYGGVGGAENALAGTAWRPGRDGGEESEGSGAEGSSSRGRGGGMSRARGRGRGSGGGGGAAAGPSGDKDTQIARDRKEAGKGSRANHDRRDQRARKVARAGFRG